MVLRVLLDGDTHRPGGAGDDLGGCIDVVGVQIGLLGLRDLLHLIPADLGDLGLVRLGRSLAHAGGLEQQLGGGRRLEREGEAAVLVDRDLHRDDVAALVLRGGVVRLAELHDVDAVLTERGPDRRRRVGLPRLDLKLDQPDDFLLRGHEIVLFLPGLRPAHAPVQSLETWPNVNSTGVSRPKIDTSTLSFCCSPLTSLIVAGSVANGPSMTVTDSPTS